MAHNYQQQDQQPQHNIPHTGAEHTHASFPQSLAGMYASSMQSTQYVQHPSNSYENYVPPTWYYTPGNITEMDRARNIALAVQLGLDDRSLNQVNAIQQQSPVFDQASRSHSLGHSNSGVSGYGQADSQSAGSSQFQAALPTNTFARSSYPTLKDSAQPYHRPLPESDQSTPEPGQIYNNIPYSVVEAGNALQLMSANSNQEQILQNYQSRQAVARSRGEHHVAEQQRAGWSVARPASLPLQRSAQAQAQAIQAMAGNGPQGRVEAAMKAMLDRASQGSLPSEQRQNNHLGGPAPVTHTTARNGPIRSQDQTFSQNAVPSDSNPGYRSNTSRPLSAGNSSINQVGSTLRQSSGNELADGGEKPRRNMLGYYSYVERRNLESMPSVAGAQQSTSGQMSNSSNSSGVLAASSPPKASLPSNDMWPAHRRRPLAMLAKQFLESHPENAGKVIYVDEILTLLNKTSNFNDLCQALEAKGFRIEKGEFARSLVNGIYQKPQKGNVPAPVPKQPYANIQGQSHISGPAGQSRSIQRPLNAVIANSSSSTDHNTLPIAHSPTLGLQNGNSQIYSNQLPGAVSDQRNSRRTGTQSAFNSISRPLSAQNNWVHPGADISQYSDNFNATYQSSATFSRNDQILGTRQGDTFQSASLPSEYTRGAHMETATFRQDACSDQLPTSHHSKDLQQNIGQSFPPGPPAYSVLNPVSMPHARRSNANHIVDLVGSDDDTISSDEDRTHPRKRARLDSKTVPAQEAGDIGRYVREAAAMPTAPPAIGAVAPSKTDASKAPSNRKSKPKIPDIMDPAIKAQLKIFKSKHLVMNINEKDAMKKTRFNLNTLARDILITKGVHPTDMPLNWHLDPLRKNFVNVGPMADLRTFRWDLVDPGAKLPQPYTPKTKDESNKALYTKFMSSQSKGREAGLISDGKRVGPPGGPNGRFVPTKSTSARDPMSLATPTILDQPPKPHVQQPTSHQSSQSNGVVRTTNTINLLHEGKMGPAKGLFTPMKTSPLRPADKREAPPMKTAVVVSTPVSTPVRAVAVRIPSNAPTPHTPAVTPSTASRLLAVSIPRSAPSTPPSAPKILAAVSIPRSRDLGVVSQRRSGAQPVESKKIELTAADLNPTKQTTGLDRARKFRDRPLLQPSAPIWRREKKPKKPKPLGYLTTVPKDGVGVIVPSRRSPTSAQELSYIEKDSETLGKKAKKPSMKAVTPTFQVFHCYWRGCTAKLHNLETLRKHVFRIHDKHAKKAASENIEVQGERFSCLWNHCGLDENSTSSFVYYTSEDAWKEHMEQKHFTAVAWELGDGPSTHPVEVEPSKYLSDSRGRQITPLARTRGPPDPLPPGSGRSPTRAYHKAHGNVTEHQKMQAELNSRIATKVMAAVVVSTPDPKLRDDVVEYEESEDGFAIRVEV